MILRVPMIGSGVTNDTYRAMLPTYTVLGVDYANNRMLVSVPDADSPDDVDAPDTARRPLINGVPVLIGMTVLQRLKWRAKLARRWDTLMDTSGLDVS